MEFLEDIRVSIGRFLLHQRYKKLARKKKVHNLKTANNIGFLYVYRNDKEFQIIEDIITGLRSELKNVKALIYLPNANLIDYAPNKISIDYFNASDLNWIYHPGKKYANDFVKSKFDVLINLDSSNFFPLEYLMMVTQAEFKVGVYDEKNESIYDLMIKVPENKRSEAIIKEIMDGLNLMHPA